MWVPLLQYHIFFHPTTQSLRLRSSHGIFVLNLPLFLLKLKVKKIKIKSTLGEKQTWGSKQPVWFEEIDLRLAHGTRANAKVFSFFYPLLSSNEGCSTKLQYRPKLCKLVGLVNRKSRRVRIAELMRIHAQCFKIWHDRASNVVDFKNILYSCLFADEDYFKVIIDS